MSGLLRVLLVDDDEASFELIATFLSLVEGPGVSMVWAPSYDDGLESLRSNSFDACLLDYRLGAHSGLDLLRESTAYGVTTPIIVLTGEGDRAVDLEAMRSGAADYLDKSELSTSVLERAIRYAIERRRALDQLRDSEQRFRTMADSAPVMLWVSDTSGAATYFNRPWLDFTGRPAKTELGQGWTDAVHDDDREACRAAYAAAFEARAAFEVEYRIRRA